MFSWIVALVVIAIIAAIFGFGGLAASAVGIAQILLWVSLILVIVGFVINRTRA